MAFTAVETIGSGVVAYGDGKPTVTRRFKCYHSDPDNDGGELTYSTLYSYLRFNVLPCGIDGRVPPNCISGIGSFDPGTGLPMRSFDIQPVQERPGTFEVSCVFSTGAFIEEAEGEPGFQEFSMSVGRTFVDGWRGGPNYPPLGTPADVDIAGDSLDSQGEPVSVPVLTQELSMGLLVTGADLSQRLDYWRSTANCRNQNAYLGAAPGTLLFPGATVDRVGPDLYRASIVLYWDEFMHARQAPLREADGSPAVSSGKAETVYWRQPFPTLKTFSFGVDLP